MNDEIIVFHSSRYLPDQDRTTEAYWAINTVPTANGFQMWFGRDTGFQLRDSGFLSATTSVDEHILDWTGKNFLRRPDMRLDVDKSEVILISTSPDRVESTELPAGIWFRISPDITLQDVQHFLTETANSLAEIYESEAIRLVDLPVYKHLFKGQNCGADISEGPLALLLLFALRLHFNEKCLRENGEENAVQVVDDDNTILPDRFDQLGEYLSETFEAFCIFHGWIKKGDVLKYGQNLLLDTAKKMNMESHTSAQGIKSIAIAMGCLPGYVDLSNVKSVVASAYF